MFFCFFDHVPPPPPNLNYQKKRMHGSKREWKSSALLQGVSVRAGGWEEGFAFFLLFPKRSFPFHFLSRFAPSRRRKRLGRLPFSLVFSLSSLFLSSSFSAPRPAGARPDLLASFRPRARSASCREQGERTTSDRHPIRYERRRRPVSDWGCLLSFFSAPQSCAESRSVPVERNGTDHRPC